MSDSAGLAFLASQAGQSLLQTLQTDILLISQAGKIIPLTPDFAALPDANSLNREQLLSRLGQSKGLASLPQRWIWQDEFAQDWLLVASPFNQASGQESAQESEPAILLSCQALPSIECPPDQNAELSQIQSRVLENMEQCLVVTDPHQAHNPIVYVSSRFLAETGYRAEEVLGRNCRFLQGTRTNPATIERIRASLRSGEVFRGEILNYRKDGTPFWNLLTISPVHNREGQISHFVGLQNDITDLKHNAEELAQSNQLLTRQNRDLQQFAYIISHNLRAPVANLLGLTPLLRQQTEDAGFRQRVLEGINESARQLDLVVGDLNTVLSLRQELQEPSELLSWQALWDQIWQNKQDTLTVPVNVELHFACPTVVSIRSYLSSMLHELLENALKFRQPDRPLSLRLQTYNQPGTVVFEFEDNGSGMDLSQHGDRLFGLYRRFHPDYPGRGIGLYLVKTRVDILGGKIEAQSQPAKGSHFQISLPQRGEYA